MRFHWSDHQPRRLVRGTLLATTVLVLLLGIAWALADGAGSLRPTSAYAAGDPVIAAAGDIACDPGSSKFNGGNGTSTECRQKATSDLLQSIANSASGLTAVLALGDNQYYCGGYDAFLGSYDLSWGRLKAITHPAVGNHEYLTSGKGTGCTASNAGAAGYFDYFDGVGQASGPAGDRGKGYYSFDVGSWHLVALNSNCSDAGGCGSTSPQGTWLKADLAAHTNLCTLAYWHIPLFSSGGRASANMKSIWQILYDNNADLVLSGHDHDYERFAPQRADGTLDQARGLRSFVVGTGGNNYTSFTTVAANSEVRNSGTFGVLKLTLGATGYTWQFVPEAGAIFTDSGTGACHGASQDTTPPTAPTNLTAPTVNSSQVSLSWTASTDNIAVVGYDVYRNTVKIGAASSTSYTDTTIAGSTTYTYYAVAVDGVGNTSAPSNSVTVTTPVKTVFTFTPLADTFVESDVPTTNFGSATTLGTDNSPQKHILMRFAVSGLNGAQVSSAKLRLFCTNPSNFGGDFRLVTDNSWGETTVTWNTEPANDPSSLAKLGSVVAGTWYEVDLTSLITAEGTYSLKIISTSSDGADYTSREGSSANWPQLVVTTGQATPVATSTPTPTSTSTPTNTPLPTSTPTGTPTPTPTSTALPTNTSTPTATPTQGPTATGTIAPTDTPTPLATGTPTPLPTSTPTATSTPASATPTSTPAPTATATPAPTNTPPPATATSTPSPTVTSTPAPTATTLTFVSSADAYVSSASPSTNFGGTTSVRLDASPIQNGYIRFNIQGLSGSVTKATLRIYANSSISAGYRVQALQVPGSSWGEQTITYANAPALSTSIVGSSGSVAAGTWTSVDVTSLVTQNGTLSLGLSTTSATALNLASREATANPPRLEVVIR